MTHKRTVARAQEIHLRAFIEAVERGENVPDSALADLLEHERPLPPNVRAYIVARLRGKIKPKRGRPVNLSRVQVDDSLVYMNPSDGVKAIVESFRREQLLAEYAELHAKLRQLRKDNPKAYERELETFTSPRTTPPERLAYAMLAERHGSTYDAIRNLIKRSPLKKRAPGK